MLLIVPAIIRMRPITVESRVIVFKLERPFEKKTMADFSLTHTPRPLRYPDLVTNSNK